MSSSAGEGVCERCRGGCPVIRVTRLDGSEFYVNAEFIQTVQSTPDTHIVLVNGNSYVVREPDREVVARIIEYRRSIADSGPRLKALQG